MPVTLFPGGADFSRIVSGAGRDSGHVEEVPDASRTRTGPDQHGAHEFGAATGPPANGVDEHEMPW